MWKDVITVRALSGYRLWVSFEDGVEGEIPLREFLSFDGVFEPLADHSYFEKVEVNPELGIVQWPNGADLDSIVLYCQITGKPVPEYSAPKPA